MEAKETKNNSRKEAIAIFLLLRNLLRRVYRTYIRCAPAAASYEKTLTPDGKDIYGKRQGLTLITNNEREFRRVRGLKVQNWAL